MLYMVGEKQKVPGKNQKENRSNIATIMLSLVAQENIEYVYDIIRSIESGSSSLLIFLDSIRQIRTSDQRVEIMSDRRADKKTVHYFNRE